MEHALHVRLTHAELTPEALEGATIYGQDDEDIGTVSHVHGIGNTAHVVVDVGGFLGIGAKPVALPINELEFMRDEDGNIHATTSWTEDELKDMPEHED